jgi:nucleotide-binding universal stress UspA family protein
MAGAAAFRGAPPPAEVLWRVVTGARPVICGIDTGDEAQHAARAAAWLARGLGVPLVLAHVFDPMAIPAYPRDEMLRMSITDADVERGARLAARRLLEGTARSVSGVEVETALQDARPARGLRRLAAERRAALLVSGTAARGGIDRILMGSVASELAAHAPCPLVAVSRDAALEEPGPLVAGFDGSSHSLRAARHAAGLAARMRRDLVLLHAAGGDRVRPDEALARELYEAGARALGDDPGRPGLDLNVEVAVEEGDPVEVLAGAARERAAALLVTGTRGRNVLSSALLGSVSAGLVRAAGRPVALVPANAG